MESTLTLGECIGNRQVAELLNVSPRTVYRLTRRPNFPRAFKLPGSRVWRWRRAELLAFIDQQGREAASHAS